MLLSTSQSALPSCLAVSSDGLLRYWFNVSLDTSFVEVSIADLRGEVPASLVSTRVSETLIFEFSVLAARFCYRIYSPRGSDGLYCFHQEFVFLC